MLIPPWVTPAAFALSAAISFGAGWKVANWQHDSRRLAEQRKGVEIQAKRQTTVETKATTLEQERADVVDRSPTIRTIYRTIAVHPQCEPDPGAIRVLQQSRDDANSRASGEPRPTVPAH